MQKESTQTTKRRPPVHQGSSVFSFPRVGERNLCIEAVSMTRTRDLKGHEGVTLTVAPKFSLKGSIITHTHFQKITKWENHHGG